MSFREILPSTICDLLSAIRNLPSTIGDLLSAICNLHLQFAVCHLPSTIYHLRLAICYLQFAIWHPRFAICYLSSAICYLLVLLLSFGVEECSDRCGRYPLCRPWLLVRSGFTESRHLWILQFNVWPSLLQIVESRSNQASIRWQLELFQRLQLNQFSIAVTAYLRLIRDRKTFNRQLAHLVHLRVIDVA